MNNHGKQMAAHLVEKETPANDHTQSDHLINRGKQSVARSRATNDFAKSLDQQKTKNEDISTDTRQILANNNNLYLLEQVKKHRC